MFEAWGRVLYRRRRLILSLTLVLVAFGVVWGTGVFGKLSSGDNFTPPASQSQREANQAARVFGRNDADVVVLYRSASMTVSDPGYRQAVTAALSGLPRADVAGGSPRTGPPDRPAWSAPTGTLLTRCSSSPGPTTPPGTRPTTRSRPNWRLRAWRPAA